MTRQALKEGNDLLQEIDEIEGRMDSLNECFKSISPYSSMDGKFYGELDIFDSTTGRRLNDIKISAKSVRKLLSSELAMEDERHTRLINKFKDL